MNDTAATKLTPAQRNEHYGKLNDRFDGRAAWLRDRGFKYETVPGMHVAVFTRTRCGRLHVVTASLVMNADEVVWEDEQDAVGRFCA
jgi:hypothetical protein